ncbi:TPA: hypothetical protein RXM03_001564 [Campylobacter jejuni]|nr:hypothetical protein [Campylobacter jejuni]HDX3382128.1 hypothetical protein [Campylobacter jejuni]HEA7272827.1 hypothetical protein [Campylobacter jejuni]HEA7995468.1 hypothetical protein [Campylobacter jejuni]HEA8180470.1 hypothetical protein [Campylobacter jejuni]
MRELSLVAFKLLNSVFKTKTAHFNDFLELDFKNKKQSFKRKKKMTSKQKIRFKERLQSKKIRLKRI